MVEVAIDMPAPDDLTPVLGRSFHVHGSRISGTNDEADGQWQHWQRRLSPSHYRLYHKSENSQAFVRFEAVAQRPWLVTRDVLRPEGLEVFRALPLFEKLDIFDLPPYPEVSSLPDGWRSMMPHHADLGRLRGDLLEGSLRDRRLRLDQALSFLGASTVLQALGWRRKATAMRRLRRSPLHGRIISLVQGFDATVNSS